MTELVYQALIDRLKADSSIYTAGAFTAICTGGIYAILGPPSETATTTFPYIVVNVRVPEFTGAFESDSVKFVATLDIYDKREMGIIAKLAAVRRRVFGDAMLQATRQPSYGLHRHTLTLPTGAVNPLSVVAHGAMLLTLIDDEAVSVDVLRSTVIYEGEIGAPQQ